LPARTVLSLFAAGGCGGRGGNGGVGGDGGTGRGGLGVKLLNINLFGDQTNSAGGGFGGDSGSADGGAGVACYSWQVAAEVLVLACGAVDALAGHQTKPVTP
jgi:hypothetical protein